MKSSLHKFWYRRDSRHFTCPKRFNSLSFLFSGCRARWGTMGTRNVWLCLDQNWRVCYASSDMNQTRLILHGLNSLTHFGFFLRSKLDFIRPKEKSSLRNFWYRRNLMHFTWPTRLNSLLFLFTSCHARWVTVGTRKVWFCLDQKREFAMQVFISKKLDTF